MSGKKIRVSAIRARAAQIAAETKTSQEDAFSALIKAHAANGVEIDFSEEPANAGDDLDFSAPPLDRPDPAKTQPSPKLPPKKK